MTGSVAIQPSGASCRPTRPLMAMKTTLLVRNRPWQELVCPAGSLPALKAAMDNGADCVYLGLRDATNARNFAGLNFDEAAIASGIAYAHQRGRKVFMALNTYPQAANPGALAQGRGPAVDMGRGRRHPGRPGPDAVRRAAPPVKLRLHLSVQGSATNRRHQLLPRAVRRRARRAAARAVAGAGAQRDREDAGRDRGVRLWQPVRDGRGRCALSSYVTGESPNTHGVCSPPKAVRWQETPKGLESRLNGVLIDRYAPAKTPATPRCARAALTWARHQLLRHRGAHQPEHAGTAAQLMKMGVRAIKIEGRQRSPAYVAQVTKVWREAIDHCLANPHRYAPKTAWMASLDQVAEGQQHTLGAYHRPWK
jgi:collagenase-like PrtC family protease